MNRIKKLQNRYENELLKDNIPFWEKYSIDHQYGGFLSCLEQDGTCYDTRKFMWMQWREVYMFAALYNSIFREERFLKYAVDGFDFLMEHARKPDGSYHYILNRQGLADADGEAGAEIFSASFAAIAGAELFRAAGEQRFADEALSACRIFRNHTGSADAPPPPEFPGRKHFNQLAYPMILLNVLQIMQNSLGNDTVSDQDVRNCIDRIRSFYNPEYGLIFERRLADGTFDLDTQDGRFNNPGHALEGLSFIFEYCRTHDDAELLNWALKTAENEFAFGWDEIGGGIRYFRDIMDKPVSKNEFMLKAWWPQCESATAMMRAFELSGNGTFLDKLEQIEAFALAHLKDPVFPEWFAYAATDGRQHHTYKGSRWKTFFHVPRYLLNNALSCRQILS